MERTINTISFVDVIEIKVLDFSSTKKQLSKNLWIEEKAWEKIKIEKITIESSNLSSNRILKKQGATIDPIVAKKIKNIPRIKDSLILYPAASLLLLAFEVSMTVQIEKEINEKTLDSFEAKEKVPKSERDLSSFNI